MVIKPMISTKIEVFIFQLSSVGYEYAVVKPLTTNSLRMLVVVWDKSTIYKLGPRIVTSVISKQACIMYLLPSAKISTISIGQLHSVKEFTVASLLHRVRLPMEITILTNKGMYIYIYI